MPHVRPRPGERELHPEFGSARESGKIAHITRLSEEPGIRSCWRPVAELWASDSSYPIATAAAEQNFDVPGDRFDYFHRSFGPRDQRPIERDIAGKAGGKGRILMSANGKSAALASYALLDLIYDLRFPIGDGIVESVQLVNRQLEKW